MDGTDPTPRGAGEPHRAGNKQGGDTADGSSGREAELPAQTRTLPALTRGSAGAALQQKLWREGGKERDEPQHQSPEADREQRPLSLPRQDPARTAVMQALSPGEEKHPANRTAPGNPQRLGETLWAAPSWTDRQTERQTDCPAPGCAYQGDLLTGRVGSTGPSSPSKWAGRQDEAWAGRVGHWPAPHCPASAARDGTGTGGGTDNTRKSWRHLGMRLCWHLAKGDTTPWVSASGQP